MIRKIIESNNFDEQERYFIERMNYHISLVQEGIDKIIQLNINIFDKTQLYDNGQVHDQSKFEDPERIPYIKLTWRHKLEKEQNGVIDYKNPGTLIHDDENKAMLHHIVSNPHHVEYWNKEQATVDPLNNRKNLQCVDANRMPPLAIAEMVADWWAMSEELKTNTAKQWFDKNKNIRWKFTLEQEVLINDLLKVLGE